MRNTLEQQVFTIVQKMKKANGRTIWLHIKRTRKIAYTTVATTLDRMYQKGYLDREEVQVRGGKNFVYRTKAVQRMLARKMLNEFVRFFGKESLSAFYEELRRR